MAGLGRNCRDADRGRRHDLRRGVHGRDGARASPGLFSVAVPHSAAAGPAVLAGARRLNPADAPAGRTAAIVHGLPGLPLPEPA